MNLRYSCVMKSVVYALTDPRSDEIRYIGRTINNVQCRYDCHVKEATFEPRVGELPSYKRNWLRSLLADGLRPGLLILEENDWTNDELNAREIYWIAKYLSDGARLTNLTLGGEGTLGHSHTEEVKQKLSETIKKWHVERRERGLDCLGDEKSMAKRVAARNEWLNNGGRAVIGAASRAAWADPAKRQQWEAALAKAGPKKSKATRERYLDPEERRKTGEAVSRGMTEESKRRIGEATIRRHGYTVPLKDVRKQCAVCDIEFAPRRRCSQTCSQECWRALATENRQRTKNLKKEASSG